MDAKQIKMVGENQEFLLGLIPNIKAFKSKSGQEGTAFFVGEKFVLKEIERPRMEFYLFSEYCEELKKFSELGLSYPKIYSWAVTPILAGGNVYKHYVLQEQIQGDELYPFTIEDVRVRCGTFCSREEFNSAMCDCDQYRALYLRIIEEFAKVCLEQNKKLETVEVAEIQRFLNSYFEINKLSVYSTPDLHSGNVIFDGKKLTIIDGSFGDKNASRWNDKNGVFDAHKHKQESFYDILDLFTSNLHIGWYLRSYKKITGDKGRLPLDLVLEENEKILGRVLESWVREAVKMFPDVKLTTKDNAELFGLVQGMISQESEEKIWQELEK